MRLYDKRKAAVEKLRWAMKQKSNKKVVKTSTLTSLTECEVHARLMAARNPGMDTSKKPSDPLAWRHVEVNGLLSTFDMWSAKSEIGTFRVTKNENGYSMYLNSTALARGFADLQAAQGYCELKREKGEGND